MAALALVLVAVGCSSRDRSVCHVNPESWCKPATVAIDNPATQTLLDVVFYVRCNSDFNLRTLPVVIRSIAPNGLECIDQAFWVFDDCRGGDS